jgi:hypothetical protein
VLGETSYTTGLKRPESLLHALKSPRKSSR